MSMSIPDRKKIKEFNSVESFIENLDSRGLLVFQVLLGQQAMKLLSEEHVTKVTKLPKESKILIPKDI